MTSTSEYADRIMAEIDHDISIGQVPATVASFSELHNYVDANDYALQCIPQDAAADWDAWMELANAVESEVSARLAARAAQSPDSEPCPKCDGRMAAGAENSETCQTCGYTWNLRP